MKKVFEPLSKIVVETDDYGVDITVDYCSGDEPQTASIDWRRLPEIAAALNELVRQKEGGRING